MILFIYLFGVLQYTQGYFTYTTLASIMVRGNQGEPTAIGRLPA